MTRLLSDDGTVVDAVHHPGSCDDRDLVVILVHGFTLSAEHRRVRRIVSVMSRSVPVVTLDLRGHGRSGGRTTVGWQEVRDVDAAVRWARALGYRRVVTTGFSLGAAVVLRHAALRGGVDAVVAVSGPGLWYYRGTAKMRTLHRAIGTAPGRLLLRVFRGTRVTSAGWPDEAPTDPRAAAAAIRVPLLVVHGEDDDYFPVAHAEELVAASDGIGVLWRERGVGHAESGMHPELVDRIARWARRTGSATVAP